MMRRLSELLYRLKAWMESFAEKPNAVVFLFLISMAEASVFPIPPDVLLIAIAIVSPKKSMKAAFWCTCGSVIGGIIGYLIGYSLLETIGIPIIEFYQAHEMWEKFVLNYERVGEWFLGIAAFTPIPYKVATIASGAVKMDFAPFILISTLVRGARFFLVGGLVGYFGASMKGFIDKYFDKLSIAFALLLIAGFLAIKILG